jgi:DNA invertase Pin-like site-specific DNA recombinase
MLLGYARVSTTDQNPELQLDALTEAGCDRLFTEHASGAATARPELEHLLDAARSGDTIVVWRLDRLGRSMKHLLDLVAYLEHRRIGLRSLNEQLDTTTANRRLIFHVMAALADFSVIWTHPRRRAEVVLAA